jgi:4-hydroxy-4-methyl-2-oxoglutarate aldolase
VVDGVLVEPGDVIVADGDGVLAIPQAHLARTLEGARQRAEREVAIRKRIKAGESLFQILNMQAAVEGAGIRQVDATWLQIKQERK